MTVDNAELAVDSKKILMSLHIVCIYKPDQYPTYYWWLLTYHNYDSATVDNHQYQLNVWSYSVWSVINFLLGSLLPALNLCDMISNLTLMKLCSSCCKHQQVNKLILATYCHFFKLLLALSLQSHCHLCHYYHHCHYYHRSLLPTVTVV